MDKIMKDFLPKTCSDNCDPTVIERCKECRSKAYEGFKQYNLMENRREQVKKQIELKRQVLRRTLVSRIIVVNESDCKTTQEASKIVKLALEIADELINQTTKGNINE